MQSALVLNRSLSPMYELVESLARYHQRANSVVLLSAQLTDLGVAVERCGSRNQNCLLAAAQGRTSTLFPPSLRRPADAVQRLGCTVTCKGVSLAPAQLAAFRLAAV